MIEALRGERTRVEIAREYDITKSLLYKWEHVFLERGPDVFRSAEMQSQELSIRDEHIADLERLVGKLALENEVLKKARCSSTHNHAETDDDLSIGRHLPGTLFVPAAGLCAQ